MPSLSHRRSLILEQGFREEALSSLQAYVDLLWAANAELNLFSRQMSADELIDNHVIDCLLPLRLFPGDVKTVADFGAGGGLPGVLYALQFPRIRFRLYEKSAKKREFLERCRALAPNLEILGEIPSKLGDVDLVTARAFKPLDVILEISREHYLRGGRYLLLKGRREKIDEEVALSRKKFKELAPRIEVLRSPLLEVERHVILLG